MAYPACFILTVLLQTLEKQIMLKDHYILRVVSRVRQFRLKFSSVLSKTVIVHILLSPFRTQSNMRGRTLRSTDFAKHFFGSVKTGSLTFPTFRTKTEMSDVP
jgi:hypothetical protein